MHAVLDQIDQTKDPFLLSRLQTCPLSIIELKTLVGWQSSDETHWKEAATGTEAGTKQKEQGTIGSYDSAWKKGKSSTNQNAQEKFKAHNLTKSFGKRSTLAHHLLRKAVSDDQRLIQ